MGKSAKRGGRKDVEGGAALFWGMGARLEETAGMSLRLGSRKAVDGIVFWSGLRGAFLG